MRFLEIFAQSREVACGRAVKRDGRTGELTVYYSLPELRVFDLRGRLAVRRWKKMIRETPQWL